MYCRHMQCMSLCVLYMDSLSHEYVSLFLSLCLLLQISIISYSVSSSLPFTSIQLSAVHPTNSTPHTKHTTAHTTPPHTLHPNHSAVFTVTVTAPETIGTYSGEILVTTSFNKTLHVPVYFKTAESRLKVSPKAIAIKGVFPGLKLKVALSVRNLYRQAIEVTSVNSDPREPLVYFEESVDGLPRLKPMEKVEVCLVFSICL